MSNLVQRIITGILFIAVIIGAVYWSEYSFLALFLLIIFLCIREYHRIVFTKLTGKDSWKRAYSWINTIFSLSICMLFFFISKGSLPLIYMTIVAMFPLIWFLIEMYSKSEMPFLNVSINSMGLFYLAVPLSTAFFLVYRGAGYEYKYMLAILFFAWANDSFAYLVGSKLGKRRLMPRISPKKSWEGTIGGAVAALGFSVLVYYVFPKLGAEEVFYPHYLALSAITIVMSTYGDLAESMIKRNLQIKDSGHGLPGHGGFLDRFDGLIFSIPSCTLYITLIGI